VPNDHDAFTHLKILCAGYRFRFGQWPERLEISPFALWGLAMQLGSENFQRVAGHLEIRSFRLSPDAQHEAELMALSGEAGVLHWLEGHKLFEEIGPIRADRERWFQLLDEVGSWLGVNLGEQQSQD
jgi:hypothetical protein